MNTVELLKYCGLEVDGVLGYWKTPGPRPTFNHYKEVLSMGEAHFEHFKPAGPQSVATNARSLDQLNRRQRKVHLEREAERLKTVERRRKGQ